MKYQPLYSNNQFDRFQLPDITYPQSFWDWINSIDWDKLQPYIRAGANALLNYLKKAYPVMYSKFGSLIESFVKAWLGGEEPPPEPTVETSDNTMLYIMLGIVVLVLLMSR